MGQSKSSKLFSPVVLQLLFLLKIVKYWFSHCVNIKAHHAQSKGALIGYKNGHATYKIPSSHKSQIQSKVCKRQIFVYTTDHKSRVGSLLLLKRRTEVVKAIEVPAIMTTQTGCTDEKCERTQVGMSETFTFEPNRTLQQLASPQAAALVAFY